MMAGRYDLRVRSAAVELLVAGLREGLTITASANEVYRRLGVPPERVVIWAKDEGIVLRPSFADFEDLRGEVVRLRAACRAKDAEIARLRAVRGAIGGDR
ncbi:hypothetical protein CXF45_07935 [Corynebacterium bovis]|nr:hypothetical protein CXF38_00065 [Corynebacterium bovis]RRO89118.1 hypothetical protein CXF45_07935 [Corynebacterium bovis]